MNLITKCPHCHTAFKVTVDQLGLYDGSVRCGICQQIFNGTEHLQQTGSDAKAKKEKDDSKKEIIPASPPPQKEKEPESDKPLLLLDDDEEELSISLTDEDINALPDREALFQALEEELSAISLELEQVTGELFEDDLNAPEEDKKEDKADPFVSALKKTDKIQFPEKSSLTTPASRYTDLSLYPNPGEPAKNRVYSTAPHLDDVANVSPAAYINPVEQNDLPEQSLQKSPFASAFYHEIDDDPNGQIPSSTASAETVKKAHQGTDTASIEPLFIRTGKKTGSGFVSGILLGLVTLLLLGTLSIQCLYMFSDRMIVWWPPSESIISKACDTFACPRRLETRISALTIESSELQIIPELKNKFALSLLIRNSSSSYQSWPHLELTLTDQEKKTIIRKIFAPANYLPNANSIMKGIPPYAEKSAGLYLEMKTDANADYRISLFYP